MTCFGYAVPAVPPEQTFATQALMPGATPAPTETIIFTAQFTALIDSCVRRMPNAKFPLSVIFLTCLLHRISRRLTADSRWAYCYLE